MSHVSKKSNLPERIRARMDLYQRIRTFFAERNVLEVETPLLSPTTALDLHLDSIECQVADNQIQYLQTSPEFAMKKCLAEEAISIFQICKAFRRGEHGKNHRHEFSMLEWYRPGLSFDGLIAETIELIQTCIPECEVKEMRYQSLFESQYQINPHCTTIDVLQYLAHEYTTVRYPEKLSLADCYDCLITHAIAEFNSARDSEKLCCLILKDFPIYQAAMSKVIMQDNNPVCKRFEVYLNNTEIANGYDELLDAKEQEQRFIADLERRQQQNLPTPPIDQDLLAAMRKGLPEMTGIALGLDRLLMVMLGCEDIEEVCLG